MLRPLVERARQGDREAFDALARHVGDRCMAIAFRILRAFRRLTLEQRAVLVFHHYLGLALPEVAQRLGIPLGTAKSRLHHATAALRASLEADARTPSLPQERLA